MIFLKVSVCYDNFTIWGPMGNFYLKTVHQNHCNLLILSAIDAIDLLKWLISLKILITADDIGTLALPWYFSIVAVIYVGQRPQWEP